MKNKFKKNLGLIILLIIALVFPTSLNYQARLNMRIIVTGMAIDKSGEDYQVTAQIVKTSPGNESPGTSAEVDFITDKAKNLSEAVAKLAYKAGKVSAFSHTNFLIVGNSLFDEDVTICLDYFIRDKIIKNSALILFSEGSAEEEIKKTKNTELSVGIGLQKVFLFKENEGDGLMVTLIDFLIENEMYSKSSVVSELSLHTNEEAKKNEDHSGSFSGQSSSESSGSSEQSSSESSGSSNGSTEAEQGSSDSGGSSSSSGSIGGSNSGSEQQYFDPDAPLVCFVDGRFVGKLKEEDEIRGYMLANKGSDMVDVMVEGVEAGRLTGEKIEVNIKKKRTKFKLSYENQTPVLNIKIDVSKAEISEIMAKEVIASLSRDEFVATKKALDEKIKSMVSKCFETAKGFGCDVFNAYELAYKFHYGKTTELFDSFDDFLKELRINIETNIIQLDY